MNSPKPASEPTSDLPVEPASDPQSHLKGDAKENPKENHRGDHKRSSKAFVGASIKITGDISGQEDLMIDGTVDGTINLLDNHVLVGEHASITANIAAKDITVEGQVQGELRGGSQVTVKPSGRVVGNIHAPRVVLNDGCQFKGTVDMDEKTANLSDRNIAGKHTPMVPPKRLPPKP